MKIDSREVRAAAQGHWLDILGALAGDVLGEVLAAPMGKHTACPFHGGEKDFRLDGPSSRLGSAAENGGAICTCGSWKDGFALLMKARGWTFPEALEAVADHLGLLRQARTPADRKRQQAHIERLKAEAERRKRQRDAERRKRADRAIRALRTAWDEALPLGHERSQPARLYLANRRLSVNAVVDHPDLRMHPNLSCFQDTDQGMAYIGKYPALLALVRDASGNPVTIHRTYLTPAGAKLPVEKPKKIMATPDFYTRLQGSAIRLFPQGRVLGVAEGLETALSVQYATGMPCWSTLSASLLQGFQPPEGIEALVIWADRDRTETGLKAARKLKRRMLEQGIRCSIQLPRLAIPDDRKGVDWADVWVQVGASGFPDRKAGRKKAA